jgi:hypothetical protein
VDCSRIRHQSEADKQHHNAHGEHLSLKWLASMDLKRMYGDRPGKIGRRLSGPGNGAQRGSALVNASAKLAIPTWMRGKELVSSNPAS